MLTLTGKRVIKPRDCNPRGNLKGQRAERLMRKNNIDPSHVILITERRDRTDALMLKLKPDGRVEMITVDGYRELSVRTRRMHRTLRKGW